VVSIDKSGAAGSGTDHAGGDDDGDSGGCGPGRSPCRCGTEWADLCEWRACSGRACAGRSAGNPAGGCEYSRGIGAGDPDQ
jgi:hypothetical protein